MDFLPKNQLWTYSFLAFPLAFAELPLFINVPKFYNEYMGLTLAHIGLILFFVRTFDALKDPFLGYLGDYTYKDKRSRYRFMATFIPLFVLAFVALWNPPVMMGYGTTVIWFVICLLAVHLADGAIIIAYHALGAEISTDYNDRTRITSVRESVRIIGLLVAAVLPSLLASFYGLPFAYACFSFLFGMCLVGFFLFAYFKGPKGLRQETHERQHKLSYFHTLKNKDFFWIVLIHSLNVFAFAIPTVLFAFFVRDIVGAPHLEGVFLMVYFLSGVAGMVLWSRVAQRIGKKQTWLYALVLGAVALFFAVFIHPGNITYFFIILIVFGTTFGADLALPPSILADVIDNRPDQEHVSTGSYFGVWNVTAKMSTALAPGLAFPVLEYSGYGHKDLGSSSLWVLAVIYAVIPATIKLITAFLLMISPLDRKKVQIPWGLEEKTV